MLKLNKTEILMKQVMKNLNTSHVKVKLPLMGIILFYMEYLNTSHVKVKQIKISIQTIFKKNLNTSHVKVKQLEEKVL